MQSKVLIVLVISFLVVALIYSSAAKVDGRRAINYTCTNNGRVYSVNVGGMAYQQTCCTTYVEPSMVFRTSTECQNCYYSKPDYSSSSFIKCDLPGITRTANTTVLQSSPVGNALPPPSNSTGTPPFGSIIKVPPGTTFAGPIISGNNNTGPVTGTTINVPPGAFKPTGNTTNATPPTTLLAKQPSSGHHHHKGGQTSTSSSNTNSTGH
jgi:hypothetical protein